VGSTLRSNIDKLHTTELGIKRIQKNLYTDMEDVVSWCKKQILDPNNIIARKGKNWYVHCEECSITINASSYTIITAHKN